ncbi:Uncharacterised protein [Mycobacteroides abscessus subsp. abscessus]|nr:Uncharacterised protein [Mycobacteroides abscessus subsp. abscessus]
MATRSPGRTTNSSPTASWSTGMRVSCPPRSTATSLAPSDSRARSAEPAERLARDSANRPASRKTVTAATTSKYT